MGKYCNHGGGQVTKNVKDNDGLHVGALAFCHIGKCAHDQEKYEDWRDALEGADEEITED